ncbi:TonB family protein [Pseudoalteromonas sp. CnMc7-15]|uniref:TonB family protein n=1 Tax=unclassified Pseudoalteromonas TaxID=194690 RepID=UPI001EF663EB|nr:TonB family protein [Pseudoalteromonas sp. CnMc7-15]MCG7566004.1 TonB family protein [Pseudoalteromonas sp. CnMc7-15]
MRRTNLASTTFVILLVSLSYALPVRGDLASATKAYQAQQYTEAYQQFKTLATLGNVDALYNLAVMNLHGQGREQNLNKAFSYFVLAGDYGLSAADNHARLIAQQLEHNPEHSEIFTQLAHQFDIREHNRRLGFENSDLGNTSTLSTTYQVQPNYPSHAIEKGIEGWVWAEFDIDASGAVKNTVVIDAYPPHVFEESVLAALKRWRYVPPESQNARRGRSLLYHFNTHKGERYRQSFTSQQRLYAEEISALVEAAEQGQSDIQYRIATWLSSEQYNVSQLLKAHWPDNNANITLLRASAQNNNAKAQYRLAKKLLNNSDPRTRQIGLNWLRVAANNQLSAAQWTMSLHTTNSERQMWLKRSAKQGHLRAQIDLVQLLLEEPKSAEQDITFWLNQAQQQDNTHPDLLWAQALFNKHRGQPYQQLMSQARQQAQSRGWSEAAYQD